MTSIQLDPYVLQELTAGLTIRHSQEGWPTWVPVMGIRVTLRTEDPLESLRTIALAYRHFVEQFGESLTWKKGPTSKARTRVKRADDLPVIDTAMRGWELDVSGLGDEKLQAFPLSFRSFGLRDPRGAYAGAMRLAVPIEWFLANPAQFEQFIAMAADIPGVQVGWAGLCGAGTPDYQSRWRAPEFFLLSTYLGIDPSEDASVSGMNTAEAGYGHSAQWVNILGDAAVARVGGIDALRESASASGLGLEARPHVTIVRSMTPPDPGYRAIPPSLQAADRLIAANRADDYFIGHGFESRSMELLGTSHGKGATLWMHRFEDGNRWSFPQRRYSGLTIESKHGVEVTPIAA